MTILVPQDRPPKSQIFAFTNQQDDSNLLLHQVYVWSESRREGVFWGQQISLPEVGIKVLRQRGQKSIKNTPKKYA